MAESFVVDASVVMAWCFQDENDDHADAVLNLLQNATAIVPSIWPLEVTNVLLVAERNKRLKRKDSMRFLTLLSELPITIEQDSYQRIVGEVFALASEYKLSSYDASYLDLAIRKGIPLATADKSLWSAVKRAKVKLI
jgi:predicted nucleic acid-binding protein